jgi:hypothetical protein
LNVNKRSAANALPRVTAYFAIFATMAVEYPPKVLLAWAEAIQGNTKIRDWLTTNGFTELGMFCFAARNKDDARAWLLSNHPHLMAVINGAESNQQAVKWLFENNFKPLAYVAVAGDGYKDGLLWLKNNGHQELAAVANALFLVKSEIERDNNDTHRISPE